MSTEKNRFFSDYRGIIEEYSELKERREEVKELKRQIEFLRDLSSFECDGCKTLYYYEIEGFRCGECRGVTCSKCFQEHSC